VAPLPVVAEVEPAISNSSFWSVLKPCQSLLVLVELQYMVNPAVAQWPVLPSS
jgi:hypothetical protein